LQPSDLIKAKHLFYLNLWNLELAKSQTTRDNITNNITLFLTFELTTVSLFSPFPYTVFTRQMANRNAMNEQDARQQQDENARRTSRRITTPDGQTGGQKCVTNKQEDDDA